MVVRLLKGLAILTVLNTRRFEDTKERDTKKLLGADVEGTETKTTRQQDNKTIRQQDNKTTRQPVSYTHLTLPTNREV